MNVWKRARRRDPEIAPEDIFADDASGAFDRARFEGRLERPLSGGVFVGVSVVLALLFCILGARAFEVQIMYGSAFAAESAHNSLSAETVFAKRGVITDRSGTVLAENVEQSDGSVRRQYAIPAMGQIIGYVSYPKKDAQGRYYDTEEKGLAGLEQSFDSVLTGENGNVLTERDALGAVRSQGTLVGARDGEKLVLSLDAGAESALANAVRQVVTTRGFAAGAGVVMDAATGEIIAIVSYPSYDPNVMSQGGPSSTIAGYLTDAGHPFLDHAVQGVYTPGSIVKPFVAAGALSDGIITPATVINDAGKIVVPDPYHPGKSFVYNGWKALGPLTVTKAIAWSSDVFFYTVGGGFENQKGLGIDRLDYWYRAFGLGEKTGINLPGEAVGTLPTPSWKQAVFGEAWYTGDTYFTAIGQYSMQVTPVQMARATAALVNGGHLVTPTVLMGQASASTTVPVAASALPTVREGMRMSVTSALAGALNVPYVSVAAKTGTAQVGAHNEYDNSWVEGFYPYDAPRYAFAVVLERGPSGTGEEAVNVMRYFLDTLRAADSPYARGTSASH